ncbi:hypothetical protein EDB85DRAFT_1902973, partial [Lactarius pseudohatsudake]
TLHVVQRGHGTVFPYATKRGLRRRPTCRRSTLRREVQAAQRENSDRSRQRAGECEDDVEEITKCEAGRMFTSLALSNVSTSSGTIAANSEGPKRGRKGRCIAVDQSRARRSEVLRFLFLCSTA